MPVEPLFPISKTKIIPPRRRAEIITRPRLIETIHSLLNKKLTLISAPAGYGKTSLLIDLADKSEIPVCWLSLDLMDQEPQRFLAYFIACIQEKFPAFGTESLAMLRNTTSVEKENERLAITFTNEIYQEIHEYFAIVLDDYQFIDPVPEIRFFINRFIQLTGENCHLILASRVLPTLPDLHLLVARDQIGGMSLEDLAFLPEEIQALFAQNSSQLISIDEARDLASKTDGWITSIALTGLSFEKGNLTQRNPAARTGIELNDYFSIEVLDRQTPEVREFLLLTSLFDDVSVDMCSNVLEPLVGIQKLDWMKVFDFVQSNNLFAIPVGNEGIYFRYHHLFQEFLQSKLQETYPNIIKKVMVRLAKFYQERNEWEKAHHIYENIGDLNARIALIEGAGTFFIRNGRVATLGNWLERLPISVLQQNPILLSLQGAVASTQGDPQLGVSLHSQAEVKFRSAGDDENLSTTLVRRAAAYHELGEYTNSLADIDEVIKLCGDKKDHYTLGNLATAQRIKGQCLFRIGNTLQALNQFQEALDLFMVIGDKTSIPILEMELGAVQYTLGNDDIAIKLYRNALRAWEATGNLGWQATLRNNLGVLYHYRGEYEKAFEMLEGAIECAQKSGYVRAQALALSSLGDLLADVHEFERSEESFDQALIIASQLGYSFLVFYSSVAKARAARLGNHLALAETILRDLFVHVQQKTTPAEEALFRLENGCLLIHTHKLNEGLSELERAVSLYEQNGQTLETCVGRLWLSAVMEVSGMTIAGELKYSELLSTYKSLKEPAPLHSAAAEIQRWAKKNNLHLHNFDLMQDLVKKAEQFTKNIPTIRRRLRRISKSAFLSAPRLVIRALGPAQVILNGKVITISDWQTRETRDLFFFFLHSKPITKEKLAAVFWPDISPERLRMRFKTSLYRLRHAVGQNTILFEGDCYRFNHDIDYEYDLETFDDLIEQATQAKTPAENATLLQAAVDLVKGQYLADIDWEWAEQERSHLEMQYHFALIRLADLYVDTSQAGRAIKICQIALENDRLMEEAYRISMRAYALMGDKAAVAHAYQTCRETLSNELGIKPSKETEILYKQLM